MDSRAFLGLQRTHNPYRWHLEVTPGLATPGNFLFGGCGLGAAISALEGTVERPCVWATARYLSFATVGEGAHIPEVIDGVDATTLAVLGDFVPMGVGQALGVRGGGTSLDNTLRIVRLVPTKWVLLDIKVHAVDHGFGHGLAHMFAEDGTLLATASQSCAVRFWPPDQDGGPPR